MCRVPQKSTENREGAVREFHVVWRVVTLDKSNCVMSLLCVPVCSGDVRIWSLQHCILQFCNSLRHSATPASQWGTPSWGVHESLRQDKILHRTNYLRLMWFWRGNDVEISVASYEFIHIGLHLSEWCSQEWKCGLQRGTNRKQRRKSFRMQ